MHSTFNRSEQGQQEVSAASGESTDPDASTQIPETIELLGADVVEKFVTNVLFHNGKINPCGEQLKVGLMQISALFLEYVPEQFNKKGNDLIKFCWPLLKCDDTSCKNWAYVVLCRYINWTIFVGVKNGIQSFIFVSKQVIFDEKFCVFFL